MKKLLFIMLVLIFTSCSQQKQIVYLSKTDTIYKEKILYDSIFVKELNYYKNDTFYIEKYLYKYKFLKDTVYRSKTDTVYNEKITVKTEYKTSGFSKFCIGFFIVAVIAILIYIIIKIRLI